MLKVNTFESILLGAMAVASLLSAGVGCYFVSELLKFQSQWWFRARWSTQQLMVVVLSKVMFLLSRAPVLLRHLENVGVQNPENLSSSLKIYNGCVSFWGIVSIYSFAFAYAGRHFIQWFNANLAMNNSNWACFIDESRICKQSSSSWFVRNKDTLGNRWLVYKSTVIFVVLLSVICAVSNLLVPNADAIFMGIVVLSFLVFLVYTSYTYPAFKDDIFIKEEKSMMAQMCLAVMLAFTILECIPMLMGWHHKSNSREIKLCIFLSELVLCSFFPLFAYAIGPSVIVRFRRPSKSLDVCGVSSIPLAFRPVSDESGRSMSFSTLVHRTDDRHLNFAETMADNIAFRKFVAHLFGEYSFENVLCFVECVKWRDRMSELLQREEASDSTMIPSSPHRNRGYSVYTPMEFGLCSEISETESSIVNGLHSLKEAMPAAKLLCDKYISSTAVFHVNLGYRTQQKVMRIIGNPELQADMDEMLFDDVINDCKRLLKDSFSRFSMKQFH